MTAAAAPPMAIALQGAASVMSTKSKKQEHLDAGRRRLEEFRKKRVKASAPQAPSKDHSLPNPQAPSKDHPLPNGTIEASRPVVEEVPQPEPAVATTFNLEDGVQHSETASTTVKDEGPRPVRTSSEPIDLAETKNRFPSPIRTMQDSEAKEAASSKVKTTDDALPPATSISKGLFDRQTFMARRNNFAAWEQRPTLVESTATRKVEVATPEDQASRTSRSTSEHKQEIATSNNRVDEAALEQVNDLVSSGRSSLEQDAEERRARNAESAALEQHIDDLTQERYALRRGLETSRTLVETLTQENTNLTEHFNQQGATINDLKAELERYQAELRSHQAVLNNMRAEKEKVQQESIVAVEQARTFAAAVIALEEKILKTRSQELKYQKEAEALREEIGVCRKQMNSMEKDRSNLKTMIEALQEEKDVLMVRLRDATKVEPPKVEPSRTNAATSTDDLVVEDRSAQDVHPLEDTFHQDTDDLPSTSSILLSSIPPEHLNMVESINTLVTELCQEKSDLLDMLRKQSGAIAELKAENLEMSQKLEHQTQQLELAVAQNMARESLASAPSPQMPQTQVVEFYDEGDEVVDRVLQWIMKLFPGGSSRKGGSKHL